MTVVDPLDVHTDRSVIRSIAGSLDFPSRLRYMPGEAESNIMWQEAMSRLPGVGLGMGMSDATERIALDDAISRECVEVVAIGFVVVNRAELVWMQLENSARHADKTFEVTDSEMRRCMQYMLQTFGEHTTAHVLWHSHYRSEEPSSTDIRDFPEWLVGVGVVHHAPTGTSRAYDRSGVISAPTSSSFSL